MKKLILPALLALAIPILVIGCAGNKTKPDLAKDLHQAVQNLNDVTQAITATTQAASQAVAAASTAVNTVVNTANQTVDAVQNIGADAQRLKDRAALITHFANYTVVKGDTLWRLSRTHYRTGFLWPMLCEQNGVTDCNRIVVGQTVRYALPEVLATYSAAELDVYRQTAYRAR
jgi:nucleoid-associated protein YgaU